MWTHDPSPGQGDEAGLRLLLDACVLDRRLGQELRRVVRLARLGQIIRLARLGQIVRLAWFGQIIRLAWLGQIVRLAWLCQVVRLAWLGQIVGRLMTSDGAVHRRHRRLECAEGGRVPGNIEVQVQTVCSV